MLPLRQVAVRWRPQQRQQGAMQRVTFSTRALAQKIAATTASTSSREEAVIASHTPVLLDEVRFTIASLGGWRLMARVESRYLRLWSYGTTHRRGVAMAPTWTAQRVLVTMLEGCYRPIPVPRCCALTSTPRYTRHNRQSNAAWPSLSA